MALVFAYTSIAGLIKEECDVLLFEKGGSMSYRRMFVYSALIWAATLALGILASSVLALTLTMSGANVDVGYTEPTTNADGSALVDLSHTNVYFDQGDGPVKGSDNAATALTGGGALNVTVLVPVTDGMERDVSMWVTATDTSGNESAPSTIETIRIDRLAPASPE